MSTFAASTGFVAPAPASGAALFFARAQMLLYAAFMYYTFIGTNPFAETSVGNRADGSSIDRIFVISMFLLAGAILAHKWREALSCAVRALPVLLVVFFCMMTIFWSDYPALTLRRGLLFFFIAAICMAIAVSVTDLRKFHTLVFGTLAAVILINLIGTAVLPHIAITDIGVRGLYTQKNVAGIVAMVTLIIGAGWIAGATSRREFLFGLAVLAMTLFFLVITRSKTSMNLAGLGMAAIVYFALAERFGARFILLTGSFGFLVLTAIVAFLAAIDFDFGLVISATTGDSSFSGRDELWEFAQRKVQDRYWLGHGYGAFWDVGEVNDPLAKVEPGSWLASVPAGLINQAHHGYLELWLNAGLPITVFAGFVVFCAGAYGAFLAIAGSGDGQTRAAFGALASLLLVHLLHNLSEATLFMRGASFCSMTLIAMFLLARAPYFTRAGAGVGDQTSKDMS